MSSLRVLLVAEDERESEQIGAALAAAGHMLLPANSLGEAAEALSLQKFDSVLLGRSASADGLPEFIARLRQLEESQRSPEGIPVLSVSTEPQFRPDDALKLGDVVGAYLSEPFNPSELADAIRNPAKIKRATSAHCAGEIELAVFQLDEFQEQVGHDPDLAAEIIDLFLSESEGQVSAMRAALARRDYAQLRPLAHTIKGSFGSLHAPRARLRAQQLETGAAQGDAETCMALLDALEADLEALKPELLALQANGGRL